MLFAFVMRTMWLNHTLFFGWEQGRDFIKLNEIAHGDLILVGPKTDINGVFHGALSYYIPLVPFLVFAGSPYYVLLSYIVLHVVSFVFLYLSAARLFSKKVGILSVFLYSISYSAIIYSQWLSNPNLVPAFVIFYLYFLIMSEEKPYFLIVAALVWGVVFHLLVVVAISLVPATIFFLYLKRIRITKQLALCVVLVVVAILSPYMLFEYKNRFIMTRSFLADDRSFGNFFVSGLSVIDQFINEVVDSIFPFSPRLGFVTFVLVLFSAVRSRAKSQSSLIVFSFLFAMPLMFMFVADAPLRHFYITVPIFVSLVSAYVIDILWHAHKERISLVILSTLVIGNLFTYISRIPESKSNFIHHAQHTYLGDMQAVIDYVYTDAKGTEFTYDYYSVPYWKEDAWIYLFQWYGKQKYGYAPAVDRTNEQRSSVYYTIIEPNESVPVHLDNWYGEYKKDSELIATFTSGKLKVEKRRERIKHNET